MMNESNNSRYWNHDHPRAFENMKTLSPSPNLDVTCPVCKGHGAYHLSHDPNTRQGFYPYFDASCGQCNGWGYVASNSSDLTCIHQWKELSIQEARKQNLFIDRYWHNFECIHCHKITACDSSD